MESHILDYIDLAQRFSDVVGTNAGEEADLGFKLPLLTSGLEFPKLGNALECVGAGAPGYFPPTCTRRMATFILPPEHTVLDEFGERLDCLQRTGYEVWGLIVGKDFSDRTIKLREKFDQVFGADAFHTHVRFMPASKRSPESSFVSVRGQFGWIGPNLVARPRVTGPNMPSEGISQDIPSIELSFCAFSNHYRRASNFSPAAALT